MSSLRVSTLQWASGGFCTFLGAAMLVAPHQFAFLGAGFAPLLLLAWGSLFLAAGFGLFSILIWTLRRPATILIHLLAGLCLLALAAEFIRIGSWIGLINYGGLGLSVLLAGFLPRAWQHLPGHSNRDLFSISMGMSTALTGLFALLQPGLYQPWTNPPPALRPWFGPVLLLAGLLLCLSQVTPPAGALFSGRGWRAVLGELASPPFQKVAYLFSAGIYLAFLVAAALPSSLWIACAYYGGFGILLAAMPWISPLISSFKPYLLQVRLAAVMSFALVISQVLIAAELRSQVQLPQQAEALLLLTLLLFLMATLLVGIILANRLARPLNALLPAFGEVANGKTDLPLPSSRVVEYQRLTQAFDEMRRRLAQRTAEREQAVAELRRLNDELEQRVAERTAALNRSEREFRTLARNLPDGVARYDPQCLPMYQNPASTRLAEQQLGPFGLPGELVNIQAGRDPVLSINRALCQAVFMTGEPVSREYSLETSAGTRSFETRYIPEVSEAGQVDSALAITREITGRKLAEKALREANDRLEAVLASITDAYYALDGEWRIIQTNRVAEQHLFRQTARQITGRVFWELFPQLAGSEFDTQYHQAVQDGAPRHFEARAGSQDRWFEAHVYPRGRGLDVYLRDISDRKQAELARDALTGQLEAAWRSAEQRADELAAIINSMADAVMIFDIQGNPVRINPAAAAILGCDPQEHAPPDLSSLHLADPSGQLILPGDRPSGQALQGKITRGMRMQLTAPDGRRYTLLSSGAPLYQQGRVSGAVVVWHDLTEHDQLQTRIARQQELLQAIFDADLTGLAVVVGPEMTHQFANPAYCRLIPHPELNPLHVSWEQVWSPTEGFQSGELLRSVLDTGRIIHLDRLEQAYPNGERRFFTFDARRLDWGDQPAALAVVWETTPLEQARLRVEQYAREAEQYAARLEVTNRDLQDFAFIASHDLQEPLRKVQAFGDRLASRYAEPLGDEGRDYLSRMTGAALRMQAMITDLLAYSRVTTKARPFIRVDLEEVAHGVLSDLEVAIERSQGRVTLEPLPTLEADPAQMRQLLQNLISNALKFHRPGQPAEVKISGKILSPAGSPGSKMVQIRVEDNGIGFDEQFRERIFQPFQRLHGRGEYEGTGIGLAICRKIAERHGGSITAEGRPGQGAAFIVTLPQKRAR